jgi:hypothetical protein
MLHVMSFCFFIYGIVVANNLLCGVTNETQAVSSSRGRSIEVSVASSVDIDWRLLRVIQLS